MHQGDMLAKWHRLERQAPDPSPMSSAAYALAAQCLPDRLRPLTILHETPAGDLSLAACVRLSGRYGPLLKMATTRWNAFFVGGAPLMTDSILPLTQELARRNVRALKLATAPLEGPFHEALSRQAAAHGLKMHVLASWRRAMLDATQTADEWWRNDISSKRRKALKRLHHRLAEAGELTFESLSPADELQPWLEDFLALEKAGWKGRRGTAIACDAMQTRFVREMTQAFHARKNLRFWRLKLNDRTIAALFAMLVGDVLWLGKIAYDETLHKFSPGVLLVVEATREILADPAVRLADSSADPGHPMIDHLWKQRKAYGDVLLATMPAAKGFAGIVALERTRLALRNRLKRAWHPLRRACH